MSTEVLTPSRPLAVCAVLCVWATVSSRHVCVRTQREWSIRLNKYTKIGDAFQVLVRQGVDTTHGASLSRRDSQGSLNSLNSLQSVQSFQSVQSTDTAASSNTTFNPTFNAPASSLIDLNAPSAPTGGMSSGLDILSLFDPVPKPQDVEAGPPTFHNGFILIERDEAERLLQCDGIAHGAFLVRESLTEPGTFALAVRDEEKVRHYRVEEEGGLFCIAGSVHKFSHLRDLVTFYRQDFVVDDKMPIQLKDSPYGYGYYPGDANTAGAPVIVNPIKEASMKCQACNNVIPPGLNFCQGCGVPKQAVSTGGESTAARAKEEDDDEWELQRKDLLLGVTIGKGNYGEVRLAKLQTPWGETIDVAVKMAKSNRMTSQAFLEEAAKMKKLRHKHIVRSFGLCTTSDPIFIVFEFLKNGSLIDFLRSRKGRSATLNQCVDMLRDVASGMAHMECQRWVGFAFSSPSPSSSCPRSSHPNAGFLFLPCSSHPKAFCSSEW